MTAAGTPLERVLVRALWDLTKNRVRYRFRTRLAVFDDVQRLWGEYGANGSAPENDAIEEELVRLIGQGLVEIGGPSNKRVRLTQQGRDHAVELLGVKPPKSPT